MLGSIANVSINELFLVGPPIVLSSICIFLLRWRLNVLLIGDPNLSNDNRISKYLLIAFCSIQVSCVVSVAGTISWIGLVIPHIGRAIIGSDNKKLIPLATLLGGSFLVVIDMLARNLSTVEVPLSILTGTIGAPLCIWIISRNIGVLVDEKTLN
jgi:iron complex transport system permease protein